MAITEKGAAISAAILASVGKAPHETKDDALRMNDWASNSPTSELQDWELSLDFKGGGKGGGNGGKGKNFDPEAVEHSASISEDGNFIFSLLEGATDKNGDDLSVVEINGQSASYDTWIELTSGARVQLRSDGALHYDTAGNFDYLNSGETVLETLSYSISDGRGGFATNLIEIEIEGDNDSVPNAAPSAVDDDIEVFAGIAVVLDVIANDVDSDGLGLSITEINGVAIAPGQHMHLASGAEIDLNLDGTLSYAPPSTQTFTSGSEALDTFSYTVADASGDTGTAVASIRIVENPTDPFPDPPAEEAPDHIQALLAGDIHRVNYEADLGTGTTVTYSFAEDVPWYYPDASFAHDGFESFNEAQRDATRDFLDQIEKMTGLVFVESDETSADMVLGIADLAGDTRGTAYLPNANGYGATPYDSDVWIDTEMAGEAFEPGTLGYVTLVHEIGHALGLKHPDSTILSGDEYSREYTVMSYVEQSGSEAEPESFMLYDIQALQYLYGANDSASDDDDTYIVGDEVRTLWDSGGIDTLDASTSSTGAILSLNQGSFSSVDGQSDNIAIANGTIIENAVGSEFDDALEGNNADNMMLGGNGADTFTLFQGGNDVVSDFEQGVDSIDLGQTLMSDLTFDATTEGLVINHENGSILLAGVEEIDEADFLFA